MAIKVRFFARMRERFGRDGDSVEYASGMRVADVWSLIADGHEPPDALLVAVNMEHVKIDTEVRDGDEVAFFPPVTGG